MLKGKKAQVSIYVIIALALVAIIGGYFLFTKVFTSNDEGSFSEVYQYYDICIANNLKDAIDLAGTQGGRVYTPEFIPGSEFAPFSSQFNFLGFGVPYWYYLSGNGVAKEQIPTKQGLEKDIAKYLDDQIPSCDFSSFVDQGYIIDLGEVSSKVTISENKVSVIVNGALKVKKAGNSATVTTRTIESMSQLGLLFDEALRIYSKEKSEAFLENYSVDVLRSNAPVDGTLIQCNPQLWSTSDVKKDLQTALEANLAAIKFKQRSNDYFSVGYESKVNARVLYSSKWPQAMEITGDGAGDGALVAKPVGTQAGLGILGFCYEPYHFVYDWRFPALIQLMAGEEVFQFPVVVIIDKNLPRKGVYSYLAESSDNNFDLCAYKTQPIVAKVYDVSLNPVEAEIKYNCFDQECSLGKTENGTLNAMAPACVNGFLTAHADGFDDQSVAFSSNEQSSAEIFMDKLYDVNLTILINGQKMEDGNALISFEGKRSVSAMIPQTKSINLSEGNYNVTVMVYSNSSLTIPASTSKQCMDVARSGLAGMLGSTTQKCFDVNLPETKIGFALIGGGNGESYILPEDLAKGNLFLEVKGLKTPSSLEELQNNYAIFDSQIVEVHS